MTLHMFQRVNLGRAHGQWHAASVEKCCIYATQNRSAREFVDQIAYNVRIMCRLHDSCKMRTYNKMSSSIGVGAFAMMHHHIYHILYR